MSRAAMKNLPSLFVVSGEIFFLTSTPSKLIFTLGTGLPWGSVTTPHTFVMASAPPVRRACPLPDAGTMILYPVVRDDQDRGSNDRHEMGRPRPSRRSPL